MASKLSLPRALCAVVVVAVAMSVLPAPGDADAAVKLDRTERSIIRKVNRIRAHHGLPRLFANRALSRSAEYHSADMLWANFFAHPSSNGDSMAKRVSAYRPSRTVGEVLAWIAHPTGRGQAGRIVSMWMRSPTHRASLLTRKFRRIGVSRRSGVLGSKRVTVFTADLATVR